MNTDLINTIHELAHAVADAQYEVDVLEAVIKQHANDEEMHYAAFVMSNAGDQAKALSSSSTTSMARKGIEAGIVATFGYKPLYNATQEQIDLAAAQQRVRLLRAEHTMYTQRFYGEFADVFGTMKKVFSVEGLVGIASSSLPLVPTPAPPPIPKPWETK